MGIYPHHSNQWRSLNAVNLFFLIGFVQMSIATVAYSYFKAKSTIEYGACFYAYTTESAVASHYLIQLWQINNISTLIEHFQAFIEKRKLCVLRTHTPLMMLFNISGVSARKKYKKLSENIEFVNKIMHFGLVRLTLVGVVQPAFFVTVANYYYYDLGKDSFYLPFPAMYGGFICTYNSN